MHWPCFCALISFLLDTQTSQPHFKVDFTMYYFCLCIIFFFFNIDLLTFFLLLSFILLQDCNFITFCRLKFSNFVSQCNFLTHLPKDLVLVVVLYTIFT
jgi:hypothetical protein